MNINNLNYAGVIVGKEIKRWTEKGNLNGDFDYDYTFILHEWSMTDEAINHNAFPEITLLERVDNETKESDYLYGFGSYLLYDCAEDIYDLIQDVFCAREEVEDDNE